MSDAPYDPTSVPNPGEPDDGRASNSDEERWSEADWQELADFLSGERSPAERAATARRLQTDPDFARLAAPLLLVWNTGLPGSHFDIDAAWAAVERKAAMRQMRQQRQQGSIASPHTPAPAVAAPSPSPSAYPAATPRGRRRPWPTINRYVPRSVPRPAWVIATFLILMLGYTTLYVAGRPREVALHAYAASSTAAHTVHLADGSSVTLAPGASLVTDGVGSGSATRLVHLEGTGTFLVRADPTNPFVVETHGISAVAIGTAFQVATQPSGGERREGKGVQGKETSSPTSSSHPSSLGTDVRVSVTSGKVVVQRQNTLGHRETLAVLGPGQETSVQTFSRYFKAGWAAAAAHKSIAEAYLEYQAMKAADSAATANRKP